MYCPVCLNESLTLAPRGIVNLTVNGKQRDTGRFMFNTLRETKEEIAKNLSKKLDEFFKWYAGFQNKEPIKYIKIFSSDFMCSNGCIIDVNMKFSVLDVLISTSSIEKILAKLGEKYGMVIELEKEVDKEKFTV